MTSYKINDVLKQLNIKNYRIIGNPRMEFSGPVSIWEGKRGCISYCEKDRVGNPVNIINNTKASVILTHKNIEVEKLNNNKTIILVEDPREIFIKILQNFFPYDIKRGEVHSSSSIDKHAKIHSSVYIGPHCIIGCCKIKENSIIHANTVINDNVQIGKNVIIGPDCVIGYDGFSYFKNKEGDLDKYLHYGGVIIEDDVELYAKVNVVRGTLDDTIIKKGTKIGNYSNIGHNVITGKNNQITIGVMVGGNTILGDNIFLGAYSVIRNSIKIGNNAIVGMGSVVTKNVSENITVFGNPARPKN